MKKILSLALAAMMVLSMGTVSFAAETSSTILKYGVEEVYEVNIPAEVNFDDNGIGEATISVGENFLISAGSKLEITVSGDDYVDKWELIDSADDTNRLTYTINDTIVNNDLVLSVDSGHDVVANPVSETLTFEVIDKLSKSGSYTDTLTFTIKVEKSLAQDENGNYLVSTAADLFTLASIVNSGEWADEEVTVLMTNSIDLKNKPFTPIGDTDGYKFYGTFDGQGYTIYNLNVTATDEATNNDSTAGLFGIVEGTIQNLNIDGATITGTHFAGAIVGVMSLDAISYIRDCHVVNATVTSNYYNEENSGDKAGALVGCLNGSFFVNCSAKDSVVTASRDAGQLTGAGIPDRVVNSSADNVSVTWNGEGRNTNIREDLIGRDASGN